MQKHNIFISWSLERSKKVAEALYEWIPMVIQSAKPWMSSADIDKGSRGLQEMAKALDGIKVGISCLTPENLEEPWILYEAGCLSKTIDDSTRLCTYLLGGLKHQDIKPPLGQFQHTSATEKDTRVLVHTINKAVSEEPLKEKTLDAVFHKMWPDLYKELKALPAKSTESVAKRSIEDMLAEILDFTRAETNRRALSISTSPVLDASSGTITINGQPAFLKYSPADSSNLYRYSSSDPSNLYRLSGIETHQIGLSGIETRPTSNFELPLEAPKAKSDKEKGTTPTPKKS